MIFAIRKSDGKVFENTGCDGLYPITFCKDKNGKEYSIPDKDIELVFRDDKRYAEIKAKYEQGE